MQMDLENQKEQISLYEMLRVSKQATTEEIKKQYKKLALELHPDKNKFKDKEEAKNKFQQITEAYQVLIDADKRKLYDETGLVENHNMAEFQEAYNYFRSVYKKIDEQDIVEFEKRYRDGPEEIEDLVDFYQRYKGDMTLILEEIPLSRNEDLDRFKKIYQKLFDDKKLKKNKKYETTINKVRLLEDESEECAQIKNESLNALALQIKSKMTQNKAFDNFLAQLQQKYEEPKNKKKGGKKSKNQKEEEQADEWEDEIDEDEFQRIQQNFKKHKQKTTEQTKIPKRVKKQ